MRTLVLLALLGCASTSASTDFAPAHGWSRRPGEREAELERREGMRRWIGAELSGCIRTRVSPLQTHAQCYLPAMAWCEAHGLERLCAEENLLIDPDALKPYPLHGARP